MDENLIYETVGKKIRALRENAKITQDTLAQILGVSRASVANYESGKQAIYLSDIFKIADYLNVRIQDILPSIEEIKAKSSPVKALEKDKSLEKEDKKEIKDFINKITKGDS